MVSQCLTSRPETLDAPAICLKCCRARAERLRVERVFQYRISSDTEEYDYVARVEAVRVWVCSECAEIHSSELPAVSLLFRLLRLFRAAVAVPMTALGLGAVFCAAAAFRSDAVFWGVLGVGALSGIPALYRIRRAVHPWAIEPPTSVTSALDFTQDQSQAFEPSWRRYTFENDTYGRAFVKGNADRIWDPNSPRAEVAGDARYSLLVAVVVVFAALAAYAVLGR
jgi:hypothetical protein